MKESAKGRFFENVKHHSCQMKIGIRDRQSWGKCIRDMGTGAKIEADEKKIYRKAPEKKAWKELTKKQKYLL